MPTTIEGGRYGLGVVRIDLGPGCEAAWGHDGSLPGWSTLLLGSRDGRRQFALSHNPYVGKDDSASGEAIGSLVAKTLCGAGTGAGAVTGSAAGAAPAPRTLRRTGPDLSVDGGGPATR